MIGVLIFLCLFPAVLRAEPVQIEMSARDCRRLTAGADYVAGVSVTGQAVPPADLNGGFSADLPDLTTADFPVFLHLTKESGFFDSGLETGYIPVAKVEIKDGRVFINGALVSENGAEALKKACEAQMKKKNRTKAD